MVQHSLDSSFAAGTLQPTKRTASISEFANSTAHITSAEEHPSGNSIRCGIVAFSRAGAPPLPSSQVRLESWINQASHVGGALCQKSPAPICGNVCQR